MSILLVVLHVISVLWLVAGLIGRDTCWWQAARAEDLSELRVIARLAGAFERLMVRPGTFVVLLTGLVAAWGRGWPILGFLQGGAHNWTLVALLVYLSILPVIALVFLPKGRVYRAALAEAGERGEMTPRLRAALADPAVGLARGYELAMVVTLVWLMVTKPF